MAMFRAKASRALLSSVRSASTRPAAAFIDYHCDRKLAMGPSTEDLQHMATEVVHINACSKFRRARALLAGDDSTANSKKVAVELLESAAQEGVPEAAHDL